MLEDETGRLESLTRLANQRRRWFWRIAFSVIVLAALVTILVLTLVDNRLSLASGIRWNLWSACLGMTLFFLAREKWRTSTRYGPSEAARAVEAEADIGQQLRTALEVASSDPSPAPGSHGFGSRLVSETDGWLRDYDWRNLVPRNVAGRWLAFTAIVAVSLFIGAAVLPEFGLGLRRILLPSTTTTYTQVAWEDPPEWFDQRHPPLLRVKVSGREAIPRLFLREDGSEEWESVDLTPRENSPIWDTILPGRETNLVAYVAAGDGKTEPLTLRFERIPELREARVSLTYPSYLGREPETRNSGDVRAIEGTRVSWTFIFDTAPARAEWTETGEGQPRELGRAATFVTPEHELKVGTQNPTLTIFDRRGSPVDSWRYEATGLIDKLPTIEILEPAKDQDATSITELPVRIRAKDDYGLGEVGVVLEAAGETKWLLERVIDVSDQRQANEMVTAMLEAVPLDITDNVRLYAYALDRKPRGGPRALSHLRSIDIRQFKQRWLFRVLPPMAGGGAPAPKMEDIAGLEKIIERQREIVSEIFVLKGGGRDSLSQELVEKSAGEAAKEEALSLDVEKLAELWEQAGRIAIDDIVLLQVAGDQMVEAANRLRIPERDEAFEIADRSLSNLLRLRKKLITLILKSNSKMPGEPPDAKERPPELASLADEARRLAREEADVRSQIEDEKLAATIDPEVTRRQQEVAVYDAGELYSNLLTHPEKTEGALSLMAEAEEFMREAGRKLDSAEEAEAVPQLALAEQRLLELAEFLELLDLEMTSAALEDLADQVEKEARELAESQSESESQSEGSSDGEAGKPSEGEEADGESESEEGEDSSKMAENGSESGSEGEEPSSEGGSPPGQRQKGKGKDSGESDLAQAEGESGSESGESGDSSGASGGEAHDPGGGDELVPDALAEAARRARLTEEILKALEERERLRNQAGKTESQGDEEGQGRGGEESQGQSDEEGGGQGDKEGEGQGELEGKGRGDENGPGQGGEEGEGQDGGKGEGRGGGRGGSRERALADLRKQLQLDELADALEEAAPGQRGSGKGKGQGAGEGTKRDAGIGEDGKNLAARLSGAGSAMRNLAKDLDTSELAHLAELKSEIAELKKRLESGSGEGGEDQQDDNPFADAPGDSSGGEDNPFAEGTGGDDRTGGENGGPGPAPGPDPKPHRGPDAEEFANRLDRLEDETVRRWGRYLRDIPFDRNSLPILEAIEKRLDELVAEIPTSPAVAGGRRKMPEDRRREIEDYFRDLSEDFGGESWIKR